MTFGSTPGGHLRLMFCLTPVSVQSCTKPCGSTIQKPSSATVRIVFAGAGDLNCQLLRDCEVRHAVAATHRHDPGISVRNSIRSLRILSARISGT